MSAGTKLPYRHNRPPSALSNLAETTHEMDRCEGGRTQPCPFEGAKREPRHTRDPEGNMVGLVKRTSEVRRRAPRTAGGTRAQSHHTSERRNWRMPNMSRETHERGLRSPAFSVMAFGLYLVGLALVLMTIPNTLLAIFGIAPTQEPWIRVAGMLAGLIGLLYVRYAPHGDRPFFELTVQLRATVIVFFLAFVLLASAPWQLLLFGAIDLGAAGWTWWTLAADRRIATA